MEDTTSVPPSVCVSRSPTTSKLHRKEALYGEEIANTLNPLVRSGKKLRLPAGNFGIMPNGQKEKELPLFGLSAGRGESEELK